MWEAKVTTTAETMPEMTWKHEVTPDRADLKIVQAMRSRIHTNQKQSAAK